jgi:hypothetical protein
MGCVNDLTKRAGTTVSDKLRGFHVRFIRSVRQLLVTANVVPSSPILVTLMMMGLRSSETSVFARPTRRNIPEDGILPSLLVHKRTTPIEDRHRPANSSTNFYG